ncbi:hypothetical protein HYX70_04155 [Candidatus Saccharibacteria bacterium]|nr:hypothetical protein [Candidatus Saccharibacteria bacterium]
MEMLRSWNGESNDLILGILTQFGLRVKNINLTKYESLSPDCFIWYFTVGDGRLAYCLYVEDFIDSLDHVKKQINRYRPEWEGDSTYLLQKVLKPQEWNKASPVVAATCYQKPKNSHEMMKYAATSAFDFVFLAKSQ